MIVQINLYDFGCSRKNITKSTDWRSKRPDRTSETNLSRIVLVNLVVRFHNKCLQLVSQFTNLSYVQIDQRLGRLPKRLYAEIDVNDAVWKGTQSRNQIPRIYILI